MSGPGTVLSVVEKRRHESNVKVEYRKRSDGLVVKTEYLWLVNESRWRINGEVVLEDLHMEMAPDGSQPPRTGP